MFGKDLSQTWIIGNQLLKLSGDLNRGYRPHDGLDSSLGIQRLGADQIKQEIKGLRLPGERDGRKQNGSEPGIGLGILKEALVQGAESLRRAIRGDGQRGFSGNVIARRKKAADPGNRASALDMDNAAETCAQNLRLVGSQNRAQPKQERGGSRTDLLDGAGYLHANRFIFVAKKHYQKVEQIGVRQTATLHQSECAGAAQCACGIGAASPHGFQLDVAHAADKNGSVVILKRRQRPAQRILGPALWIGLDRVRKETVESN